jgi:hypothetical protein
MTTIDALILITISGIDVTASPQQVRQRLQKDKCSSMASPRFASRCVLLPESYVCAK